MGCKEVAWAVAVCSPVVVVVVVVALQCYINTDEWLIQNATEDPSRNSFAPDPKPQTVHEA